MRTGPSRRVQEQGWNKLGRGCLILVSNFKQGKKTYTVFLAACLIPWILQQNKSGFREELIRTRVPLQ